MLDKYEGLEPIGNLQGTEVCFYTLRKMDGETPKIDCVPFMHAAMPYAKKNGNVFFDPLRTTGSTIQIINAINVLSNEIFAVHKKMKDCANNIGNEQDEINSASSPFLYHNMLCIYNTRIYQIVSLMEKLMGMFVVWSCGDKYQKNFIDESKSIPVTFYDVIEKKYEQEDFFGKIFPEEQDKELASVIYETNIAFSGFSSTYTTNIVGEEIPTVCAVYLDLQEKAFRYHNHALSQIIFGLDDLVKRHGILS